MRCTLTLLVLAAATVLPGCFAMHYVPAGGGVRGVTSPDVEVVRFPTTDGLTLEGRMYPAECDRARAKEAKVPPARLPQGYQRTVVLHCHGVGDNNTSAMACFFCEAGFRVFQFDYRGFGHSDRAAMTNPGFADDAVAALAYLRTRPDVDPKRILVYGHSMGAAYALAAAAHARAEDRPVRAVVTANGFSSWRLIANHHLPLLGFVLGGVPGPDPADWAAKLGDTPYLVAHVQDDRDVPVENAARLYAAAVRGKVPASMHIHPDGGHAFPFWTTLEENGLERTMVDFAKTWLAERPPLTPRLRKMAFDGGAWAIEVKSTEYERSDALSSRVVLPEATPAPAESKPETPGRPGTPEATPK